MPAADLAPRLSTAIENGSPPDVLVIDNYGLITGTTTSLGTFVGIEQNVRVKSQLVRVTGSFDGLLGPQRGWTFLLSTSANHAAARRMALRTPDCGNTGPVVQTDELTETVPEIVRAYLWSNSDTLQGYSDADRVTVVTPTADLVAMLDIRVCGMWGQGQPFGDFVWETAPSRNVVATIAEFAYKGVCV
jgi:hypothetical protein